MYIWSNKILNLYDYIFHNENYEDTKDTSKRILSIRKCIGLKWWNSKNNFKSFRRWQHPWVKQKSEIYQKYYQ